MIKALDMNTKTINGVAFTAVRYKHPRKAGAVWRAKVDVTGEELPQGYATRPAMWNDLTTLAVLLDERFAKQLGIF